MVESPRPDKSLEKPKEKPQDIADMTVVARDKEEQDQEDHIGQKLSQQVPLSRCTDTEKLAMLTEAILDNRKRTFQMYKRERQEYRVAEIDHIIGQKVRMKVSERYENIGKIPGVKLDAIKRAKILKDLQVKEEHAPEEVKLVDQEKIEGQAGQSAASKPDISLTVQNTIEDIEREKQLVETSNKQISEKSQSLV